MKITNEIMLILWIVLIVVSALALLDAHGPDSEPLTCEVGPMEAAQCRAQGRLVARALGMWEVRR